MPYIQDSDLPLLFTLKPGSALLHANPYLSSVPSMGGNYGRRAGRAFSSNTVAQALEEARETEEGARDPRVQEILEHALSEVWSKVQAEPNLYVMTRDEFAIFNYFQHRFEGNQIAVAARRRYWDSRQPTNGHR
ncbi:hypothetical protein BP5796_02604 [Coleophoma crateriformis]|uniref:Uncharacterized protein n=2 Tax=Coleophoma TaxID=453209 RepID=A0A3D8QHD9_9HELO|nr:hypothetical protein BP6252_12217 [Coleophoma cylindrospora]RDW91439.1 hypothetical protein BP5796_02604 [Coleophoma crateriformis]